MRSLLVRARFGERVAGILLYKVAKGRLKMGFRRPFLGRQDILGTNYDLPVIKSIYLRLIRQFLLTLPIFLKLLFCFRLIKN